MAAANNILGIDIGSVCIHIAHLNTDGEMMNLESAAHNGDIKGTIETLMTSFEDPALFHVAVTDSTPDFVSRTRSYDDQLALMRGAKYFHKKFDAILHVGGEKFSLSRFDAHQNYIGVRHNTSCAAGTGSFLDQQAARLNLPGGSAQLSKKALCNHEDIPPIATRCAVFAKTDLIHAQQEGFSIEQICDGLCFGLAKNISDTLFKTIDIGRKILFSGGVSHNLSVKQHLEEITGYALTVDPQSKFYGAVGAAFCFLDEYEVEDEAASSLLFSRTQLYNIGEIKESLKYPPLSLKLSSYPDFQTVASSLQDGVEIDVYMDLKNRTTLSGYLGLDVGSTSTKSIFIDENMTPVAGFYTKTASRPVEAVQKIFKAYDDLFREWGIEPMVLGCGTTGSGRRLSARIIGADIEPDEITAHATAACHLNPDVDTIIEIGGQDAKFTLLKNQVVTSSFMNTVCAAGTGSFIEEQAIKLGTPLSQYSDLAEGVSAPVASDRCTVFMERDMNHFFSTGHSKRQVLASVLHSVRDNYLTKVASIGKIGDCILFQGATARNKALVAAFEQRLNKPIHVSRYCHLTGAMGVALMAAREVSQYSTFSGFGLWRQQIPVRHEVCDICNNHCKLTLAKMDGKTLAYGFLCGRDYDTPKMVVKKKAHDLLKIHSKAVPVKIQPSKKRPFTIGIPKALHQFDDFEFWQHFFTCLNIKTIKVADRFNAVKKGKTIAAAEFCAPVMALHGQVRYLSEHSDYIFLPFYFEDKQPRKDCRRQYCYYSQFAPSVVSCVPEIAKEKIISPVIKYLYTNFYTKRELYRVLKKIDNTLSFFDISRAYDESLKYKDQYAHNRLKAYQGVKADHSKLNVVFVGRPYTILDRQMNSNIPGIFENLGVRTFFQDMIDTADTDFKPIEPFLNEIHWKYAATILKTAYIAATSENLYPVYISSFRCAPDSFAIDYFKRIMENVGKPYLILELDDHDSSVGYETRVEAAVRAFSNHHNANTAPRKLPELAGMNPSYLKEIGEKTIVFPNWDAYTGAFIVSVMKSEGYNAVLMEETQDTLKKSILTNTGQCLPLNAVAQAFIHTVESRNLDPAKSALWLNPSEIACNIKLYPYHIKNLLTAYGKGFENATIYKGELSLFDISFRASTNAYFAYMFGGLLRSIGCKIRPYEIEQGQTDAALQSALSILCNAFEYGTSKETALEQAVSLFTRITQRTEYRPKVGIFGDLYVRDNDVMNQNLVRFIEEHGGEVITTPYYKYLKIIAHSYFKKWFKEGKYLSLISNKALLVAMQAMEKKYYKYFDPILDADEFKVKEIRETVLNEYGVLQEHTGESMDNILKIHHLINEYPDLSLLVQANPAFCCPGLITEAMTQKLEKKTGIPIVSITYDVSGGNKNKVIIPFLKNRIRPLSQGYSQSRKVSV